MGERRCGCLWEGRPPTRSTFCLPATAGDLEAPRGHEWVVLLYPTKPRISVSPGKEEEGEVEARNTEAIIKE